jgi:hypothetical protein
VRAAAKVKMVFHEGEPLTLPFVTVAAAQAFYDKAQLRHDVRSVSFVDAATEAVYAEKKRI